MRCGVRLNDQRPLHVKSDAADNQEQSQPGQRTPWPVAVAEHDVLHHAPELGEWRCFPPLFPLPDVPDGPRILGLADLNVVSGQVLIRLGLRSVRVPGQPAQPVPGWQPRLKSLVRHPVDAHLFRPRGWSSRYTSMRAWPKSTSPAIGSAGASDSCPAASARALIAGPPSPAMRICSRFSRPAILPPVILSPPTTDVRRQITSPAISAPESLQAMSP